MLSVIQPVLSESKETAKVEFSELCFRVSVSAGDKLLPNGKFKLHERYEIVPDTRMVWLTYDSDRKNSSMPHLTDGKYWMFANFNVGLLFRRIRA